MFLWSFIWSTWFFGQFLSENLLTGNHFSLNTNLLLIFFFAKNSFSGREFRQEFKENAEGWTIWDDGELLFSLLLSISIFCTMSVVKLTISAKNEIRDQQISVKLEPFMNYFRCSCLNQSTASLLISTRLMKILF